jgi:hypothetical protein
VNHTITIGDLFATGGVILGLALSAVGALVVFAGGMSDAPSEGDSAARHGCGLGIIGALILAASIWQIVG